MMNTVASFDTPSIWSTAAASTDSGLSLGRDLYSSPWQNDSFPSLTVPSTQMVHTLYEQHDHTHEPVVEDSHDDELAAIFDSFALHRAAHLSDDTCSTTSTTSDALSVASLSPPHNSTSHLCRDSSLATDSDSSFSASMREETMQRVAKQVEFYFGDRNFPTDKFLRKHTKANAGGFVPLSVVQVYKKMKKITDDLQLMADALENNAVVELSADGTAIRRKTKPPKYNPETICHATAIVFATAAAHVPSTMDIYSGFKQFGDIVQIRSLAPGSTFADLPSEMRHVFTHWASLPPALQYICQPAFLVEFDFSDEVMDAVNFYTPAEGEYSPYHVQPLLKRTKNKKNSIPSTTNTPAEQKQPISSAPRQQMPQHRHNAAATRSNQPVHPHSKLMYQTRQLPFHHPGLMTMPQYQHMAMQQQMLQQQRQRPMSPHRSRMHSMFM
eukprot:m.223039 g.223039  ORF g.223039 m.223039 type:complete len:441 (+) comp15135_c0_seq1:423-1745(+)